MGMRLSTSATLAANVKKARKAANLTQPQVAQAALNKGYKVDQGTVSRVERAAMNPSLDILEAIAHALDVEPWQLLVPGFDPDNQPLLRDATPEERELWKRLRDAARQLGISE